MSPLIIFLILLGVLLIGYLIGHVWENFQEKSREGFGSSTDAILVNGYSSSIVPLVPGTLFYDPVHGNIVNTPAGSVSMYMRTSGGSDLSFNMNGGGGGSKYKVVDEGFGFVEVEPPAEMTMAYGPSWVTNLGGAIDFFTNLSGDDHAIFMDVTFDKPASDVLPDTALLGRFAGQNSGMRFYSNSSLSVAVTNASYPAFTTESFDDTKSFRRFHRVLDVKATSFDVVNLPESTPSNFTFTSKIYSRYGVIHIPVPSTGVVFLHVIDFSTKQHLDTFYFNSTTKNVASFHHGTDIISSIKTTRNLPSKLSAIDGTGVTPHTVNMTDIDFDVKTKYSRSENTIHVVGSKQESIGHTSFYAILSFSGNNKITINYSSTKVGDAAVGIVNSNTTDYESDSESDSGNGEYSSILNETGNLYGNSGFNDFTMDRVRMMKIMFGSSLNDDYMLKTEVIPPVCSSCPTCDNGNGVCTNCGGNGGGGTFTTPPFTNAPGKDKGSGFLGEVKDDVGAIVDEVKEDIGDVYNAGKDAVGDVYGAGKDAIGDVYGAGKDAVGDVYGAVGDVYGAGKDAVGDVFGAGRDMVEGTVGLGRDAVEGTVGLGRELLGGVAGIFSDGDDEAVPVEATPTSSYQAAYGGLQPSTMGQDPYSYFGAVPARNQGGSNFVPRLADFSHFGK